MLFDFGVRVRRDLFFEGVLVRTLSLGECVSTLDPDSESLLLASSCRSASASISMSLMSPLNPNVSCMAESLSVLDRLSWAAVSMVGSVSDSFVVERFGEAAAL